MKGDFNTEIEERSLEYLLNFVFDDNKSILFVCNKSYIAILKDINDFYWIYDPKSIDKIDG